MINSKQLNQIKEFAVDLDWNQAFGGKSKGNRHLFRAVALAKEMIKQVREKGSPVEESIVEAGTWLHDSGLVVDLQGDALCNQEQVSAFLSSIGISSEDLDKVLHCIDAHDGRNKALSLEAQIVHDADTLEKLGPLGIIRETLKRSQLGWNTEKIAAHLQEHLEKRRKNLYTDPARKMAEMLGDPLEEFFGTLNLQLKEENKTKN